MADVVNRSNNIEHNKSKETDELDLLKSKMSDDLVISKTGPASDPPNAIDLLEPVANNSLQDTNVNQMSNGREKTTEAVKVEILFNQDDGSRTTLASNNNNDRRSFRKSQSMTVLTETRDDECATCDQEEEGDTLESLRSTELQDELMKLKKALTRKEEECLNLTHVQLQTGQEVEELTASLFEEANKMVQDANIKRMATEKSLAEAYNRIEVLQAEVTALKALVLTSTPSKPNPHLNPQIDKTKKTEVRGHRRSTSHHSFIKEIQLPKFNLHNEVCAPEQPKPVEESEPELMKDFRLWRGSPNLNVSSPFLCSIINEDVLPCLNFANVELSKKVFDGIFSNTVSVEPLVSQKMIDCQHCALSEKDTACAHCFKLGDLQTPFAISKMVRNRIIAVCDFVTYLRYIMQGLVKSSEKEMFNELLQLRKKMCLARLGLEE